MSNLTRYNETVNSVVDIINDILLDFNYPYKSISRPFDDNYYNTEFAQNPISYKEKEAGIEVVFKVPGYGKEDLQLSCLEGTLIVEDRNSTLKLKAYLNKKINTDTLKAKCEKGILTVTAQYFSNPKKLIDIE